MPDDTTKPAQLQITQEDAGLRLDIFLARRFPERSRTFFHDAIKNGHVILNARPGRTADRLRTGDTITVAWPPERQFELKAEAMALDILHEDDDILVINKPAGLVVHPAKGNWTGTLVQGLLAHAGEELAELLDDEMRPGIVHRLDKDTSGALVIAKNPKSLSALQQMFQEHTVEKTYLALATGSFPGAARPVPAAGSTLVTSRAAQTAAVSPAHGKPAAEARFRIIEDHIGRHPRERKRMAVVSAEAGKPAVTHYRVLAGTDKASLLEVRILTGRTHQIRVHLAHIKHPVIGDGVYGGRQAGLPVRPARQMLHAWKLAFTHPGTGERIAFTAPVPEDFRKAMAGLGIQAPAGFYAEG
jgi:23S rRNA pseudouridine1911/1915/1917 synthase